MQNGSYNTYTSTLASSSSSRSFSLVGCHIGISKYLTIKGQTTLSRTKNKKYLPPSEIRNAKQKLLHLKCKMEAIKLTHRLWHRAIRQGPFRWWGAI